VTPGELRGGKKGKRTNKQPDASKRETASSWSEADGRKKRFRKRQKMGRSIAGGGIVRG